MNKKNKLARFILFSSLMAIMLLTLACSLPFNLPSDVMPEEWQPQEEPFHEEEPWGEEPPPEEPWGEEPPPEEHMQEEPPPPGEEPPPEPEPQQQQPPAQQSSGGQNQPFMADLAVTDIFPGKMPHGMFHARITNHGPGTLSKVTVPVMCQYIRTDKKTFAQSQETANITVTLNLSPGKTQEFPTTLSLDTTVFDYIVACEVKPNFNDPNPNNNLYNEMIK